MIKNSRFSRRAVSCLIGFAIASTIALATVQVSSATSYGFRSCDAASRNNMSFGEDWQTTGLGSVIHAKNDCPNGFRIDMRKPVPQETKSVIWFQPSSDSTIKAVRFKYYGGDTSGVDYAYSVRSCAYLCDEVAQLAPGGSSDSMKTAMLTMPPLPGPLEPDQGDASVAIQIECLEVICPDPPEMVVKNFEFEYDDSVSPTLSNFETDPANAIGTTGPTGATSPQWMRGENFKLAFDISDTGSGVHSADLGVDAKFPRTIVIDRCSNPRGALLCDRDVSAEATVDTRGLDDGAHSVALSAFDGAGSQPTKEEFSFLLDNGDPSEPTGLEFSDNVTEWNWTDEPGIVVSHDDAALDSKNTEHSGFKSAHFDIRPSVNEAAVVENELADPAGPAELTIPHEGMWDVGVSYSDNAGNISNRAHGAVGYDSDVPAPPDPVGLDWISLEQLRGGVDQVWDPPGADSELESGICAYAFLVDDELLTIPDAVPDVIAPISAARVPIEIGEGRHFAHIRSIACNGMASEQEPSPINVDGTPPTPTLHGLSSGGWLTAQPNLSLSATDAHSGVAGFEYGFEGASALKLVPGGSTPIPTPQGTRTISYRAIDVVGNTSKLIEREFKADWTPPAAEFQPRDPMRPNVVTAVVDDAHSGLAGLGMQIRRSDPGASAFESSWRDLGDFESLPNPGAKSRTITRSVPDGQLPEGTYAVRVNARDVAGNWSESGPELPLSLPVRAEPSLSTAIAIVEKGSKVNWSGASQDRVVRFGESAALVGSLVDGSRNPIPNAAITVTTTPQFGIPSQRKSVSTDARGEFVVRLAKGPTRRFDLHFDGNERFQPVDQTADIRVRAALSFRASPKRVRSGKPFTLSGQLLSGSIGLPEGGKIVLIEFRRMNKWIPTIATPRVDSRGRFKVRWDGVDVRKATTVYFRVRAKREGTWPFLSGSSKPFALRVKP